MTAPLLQLQLEMAEKIAAAVDAADPPIEIQVAHLYVLSPTPPTVDIWLGGQIRDTQTAGFQDISGEHLFTVRARVNTIDPDGGQELLIRLMDDEDDISVAAALMDDQTLNGLASSVDVVEFTGLQDGGSDLLACTWRVRVLRVTS